VIIYQIRLPKKQDAEAFVKVLLEDTSLLFIREQRALAK
jgi:hypothetical protein